MKSIFIIKMLTGALEEDGDLAGDLVLKKKMTWF
jgi:hypothetical protein